MNCRDSKLINGVMIYFNNPNTWPRGIYSNSVLTIIVKEQGKDVQVMDNSELKFRPVGIIATGYIFYKIGDIDETK